MDNLQMELNQKRFEAYKNGLEADLERILTKDWEGILIASMEEAMDSRHGYMGTVRRFKEKIVDLRINGLGFHNDLNIAKRLQNVTEDLTLIYEDLKSLEGDNDALLDVIFYILEDLRAASGEY